MCPSSHTSLALVVARNAVAIRIPPTPYTFDYSRIGRDVSARPFLSFLCHLDYSDSFSHLSATAQPFAMLQHDDDAAAASLQTRQPLFNGGEMSNYFVSFFFSSSFFFTAASSSNSQASSTIVIRGCSLPPEIPGAKYQILPWRRSFSSASFSPISSRVWNLNGSSSTPPLVPIYSSAMYSCHRGFLTGGSSLISCTPGGWWQPTHNLPRCVPHGSSASSSSASGINLHHHGTAPRNILVSFFVSFPSFPPFIQQHRLAAADPDRLRIRSRGGVK